MERETITTQQIWMGILFVILFVAGYISADQLLLRLNREDRTEDIERRVDQIEKVLAPYERKERMKRVKIIEDFSNSSENNEPTRVFEKSLVVTGSIKEGYLYVISSVGGKAFTEHDGVYLKLTGSVDLDHIEVGGHLIAERSLSVPVSEDRTELLFELSDIKYKEHYYDPDLKIFSGNWTKILNQGENLSILGFVSTERTGTIEEVVIYYACTEGQSCSIDLVN